MFLVRGCLPRHLKNAAVLEIGGVFFNAERAVVLA